jgi:nitrate/nitrite-specific signal transduction histidine kinase
MSDDLFERADEFLAVFRRGAEFTKGLVEENARLRRRLALVESRQDEAAQDSGEWQKLRQELLERIRGLEGERIDVLERMRVLEHENRQFASRFAEVEAENNNLANLYVASYQLHSTLDVAEVVKITIEIVINLIGAQTFAIYVHDEKTGLLEAVAAEGEDVAVFPSMPLGEGVVGSAVATGATFCTAERTSSDYSRPIVAIPLRVNDRPIGAIAIFGLLVQKDGLSPLDHELFTLLAGHAATAIFAAQLHSQSERKLSTIQGFIDLLTKQRGPNE